MMMQANITLLRLRRIYDKYTTQGVRKIVCNEGGSRSAKTWDTLLFYVWYCLANKGKGKKLRVFRDTLVNCRTTVYDDFTQILRMLGLEAFANIRESGAPRCQLFGNTIYFHGLDDWTKVEGLPSDVLFFNEALEVNRKCFETLLMRCSELCILDWNPRYTQHWCFELSKRSDAIFCHSTYKDNHHLADTIRKGIEAYEPTAENIAAGTADEWRWKVYGLGICAAMEGLVYPDVEWIEEFPDDCDYVTLGMDFGFTNDPTALVRCGMKGEDLFVELLVYHPFDDPSKLYDAIAPHFNGHLYCICDSADRYAKNPMGMVTALGAKGLRVAKAVKRAGSIADGIQQVKQFRIHIVENKHARDEQGAYCYAMVNGIRVNSPIDDHNHMWDAVRYVVQNEFAGRLASLHYRSRS